MSPRLGLLPTWDSQGGTMGTWSGVAMTKSWFRPSSATYWMCDLGNFASLCLIISI